MISRNLAIVAIAAISIWPVAARQNSNYTSMAHDVVAKKLSSDWGENVRVQWLSTNVRRIDSDTVKVDGKGLASSISQSNHVSFNYYVTLYPRSGRKAMITIDTQGNVDPDWGRGGLRVGRNDASYRARARTLAEKELERQMGMNLKVTFATQNMSASKTNQRAVSGNGTWWARDRNRPGRFNYVSVFDTKTGRYISTQVRVTSKPG